VRKWESTQTPGSCSPSKTDCKPYYFITMSKQVLISMLRKGANGEQILNILDAITSNSVTEILDATSDMNVPTLDEISF
jgi:hypothetical protein